MGKDHRRVSDHHGLSFRSVSHCDAARSHSGVLLIISGVMLMRSAKAVAALQEGLEENAEENMLAHYASFIKMQFFTRHPVWYWAFSLLF